MKNKAISIKLCTTQRKKHFYVLFAKKFDCAQRHICPKLRYSETPGGMSMRLSFLTVTNFSPHLFCTYSVCRPTWAVKRTELHRFDRAETMTANCGKGKHSSSSLVGWLRRWVFHGGRYGGKWWRRWRWRRCWCRAKQKCAKLHSPENMDALQITVCRTRAGGDVMQ